MVSMPITVICSDSLSTGFELAGAKSFGVRTPDQARELLLAFAAESRYGIVLVADDLTASLSERERALLDDSRTPIFVPMPIHISADEPGRKIAERVVEQLIQQAIGRRISLAS